VSFTLYEYDADYDDYDVDDCDDCDYDAMKKTAPEPSIHIYSYHIGVAFKV